MTRINVGINPRNLSDKHLLAEHREIKRIPNHLRKYGLKCLSNAPKQFTLGKGHVLFFIDKGRYTYRRYQRIYEECIKRGFNVTDYSNAWNIYHEQNILKLQDENKIFLWGNYKPTPEDKQLIKDRIASKIK